MLHVENVTKMFGGLVALRGVSLSLSQGQIKSIIGPNGAGKTTLFNLISGFMAPREGEIRFNNQSITGQPPEKIAHAGDLLGIPLLDHIIVARSGAVSLSEAGCTSIPFIPTQLGCEQHPES